MWRTKENIKTLITILKKNFRVQKNYKIKLRNWSKTNKITNKWAVRQKRILEVFHSRILTSEQQNFQKENTWNKEIGLYLRNVTRKVSRVDVYAFKYK